MIHLARNSARRRDRSHEMMGLQPLLWEQGLPAHEKPPAQLNVIKLVKLQIDKTCTDFIVSIFVKFYCMQKSAVLILL